MRIHHGIDELRLKEEVIDHFNYEFYCCTATCYLHCLQQTVGHVVENGLYKCAWHLTHTNGWIHGTHYFLV